MIRTLKHTKKSVIATSLTALLLALGIFTAISIEQSLSQKSASAASLANFTPGDIMSDAVMSDDGSMTVSQIQSFLKSKVSSCNSKGPYSNGSYYIDKLTISNNGTLATTKDGKISWNIKNGHFICMADDKFGGKSAAQIIYDTAKEFHINPQVLIVLLQKEQGLITDDYPNSLQYNTATGYGCPDTAACDTKYYGLKNQLRNAASLFREVLDGGWSNYPVGNNYVQYNPVKSCGGTTINIKNRATSALYRYTPYQPNKSALNAGYGSGDGCGAYGNRNFYLYFTDWFGSTHYDIKGSIGALYNSGNGVVLLGEAIENESRFAGGWKQCFENGCIVGSSSTDYYMIKGSIGTYYKSSQSGIASALGLPTGPESSIANGWYQPFQSGYIAGRKNTGYWAVKGSIGRAYSLPEHADELGLPVAIEESNNPSVWEQSFDDGIIFGSSKTGYWSTSNDLHNYWIQNGGVDYRVGLPADNLKQSADGKDWQSFQAGIISGNKDDGFIAVAGSIYPAYETVGGIAGSLGSPISAEESKGNRIYQQQFKSGYIVGKSGKYFESRGPIRDYWTTLGQWNGKMGLPIGPIQGSLPGAIWQHYEHGTLIMNPKNNEVWESKGSIRTQWQKLGYQNGVLGYPTGPEIYTNGEYSQTYEHGTIKSRRGTTSYTLN